MLDQELFDGEVRTTIDDDENLSFRRANPASPGSRVISWANFKNLLRTLFVDKSTDQIIDGEKTFNTSPKVPDPTEDLGSVNLRTLNAAAANTGQKADISTGVVFGGEISLNVDPTKIDIEAGEAYVVNSYTNPQNTTFVKLTWAKQIGISITNINTQLITYICVKDDGTGNPEFLQSPSTQTTIESRSVVELGLAVHDNLSTVSKVTSFANRTKDIDLKILDFSVAFGRINVQGGNEYTFNGANLQINKSAGRMFGPGANYGNSKEDPNYINSPAETGLIFKTVYNNSGTQVGESNTVDTSNYNPLGEGGLVPIPSKLWTTIGIFFSPETGLTILHYGQYLYDSGKNAIDSWRREKYKIVPELSGVALRGVIAVKSGATDLSDPEQAKFIDPGSLGLLTNENINTYSRYAEPVELLNGLSSFSVDIDLIESGGVIYAEIERDGGGDVDYVFNQREYPLNCTTGPGTGGKARIALTAGPSATVSQTNWIYAIRSGDVAILQVSSSRPTGEFAYIHLCELPNVATFLTDDADLEQRYNDAKSFDGRSAVQRSSEWIRTRRPEYENGMVQTVSINTTPSPDSIDYTQSVGSAWQKHLQANVPELQVSVDGIKIANHPTTPGLKVTDLNSVELLQDSAGNSLSGASFNWVIWVSVGYKGNSKLWINLPESADSSDAAAVSKQNNGDRSIPKKYKSVGVLVASLPFKHSPSGGGTYTNLAATLLSKQVIDIRGEMPGSNTGGTSGTSIVNEFLDSLFRIISNTTGFKLRAILNAFTADRNIEFQDKDGTVAMLDDIGASTPEWPLNAVTPLDSSNYAPDLAKSDVDDKAVVNGTTELNFITPINVSTTKGRKKYIVIDNSANSSDIDAINFTGYKFIDGYIPQKIAANSNDSLIIEIFNNLGVVNAKVISNKLASVEKPFSETISIAELLSHSLNYTQTTILNIIKGTGVFIGGTYQVVITTDGKAINFSNDFIIFNNDYSSLDIGEYLFVFAYLPDGRIGASISATSSDEIPPTITGFNDTGLNLSILVNFNEGIYGADDGLTPIDAADLIVTNFVASGATAVSIASVEKSAGGALTGGETSVKCNLSITGTADGTETFQIQPADGVSVYDKAGNAMLATETTGTITLNVGLTTLIDKTFEDLTGWTASAVNPEDSAEIADDSGTNKLFLDYQSLDLNGPVAFKTGIFTVNDTIKITVEGVNLVQGNLVVFVGASSGADFSSNITTNGTTVIDNIDTTGFGGDYIILGTRKNQANIDTGYIRRIIVEKY